MLGKKTRNQPPISTLVGVETRVHGDIEFAGGFHVDGYVKGNVQAVNDDTSVLSISERGCIEGSVIVPHVLLNGTVKGDVRATERVEVGPRPASSATYNTSSSRCRSAPKSTAS